MAIYHLTMRVHGRTIGPRGGKSILACAAYRSRSVLCDELTGRRYDYSRRLDLESAFIAAPPSAPAWSRNRQYLWNEVEKSERRKDAQLAREIEVSLPRELDRQQREALVRQYIAPLVLEGMVADVAVHNPTASDNQEQPHAHILLTLRACGPEGFSSKKNASGTVKIFWPASVADGRSK